MTVLEDGLIALRREIHRHPELAGEERRTAGLVAEQLRAAGLEVTTGVGGHGVLAVLDGSADGPTVMYRADMDAVDVRYNSLDFPRTSPVFDEGFASLVPDVAHLCGHDLHTAIGVGVARALARDSGRVRGRLAFVFQPAEEPLQGARAMLATGLVQKLAPRESYALHCAPFPAGTVTVSPGHGLPGVDNIRIMLPGGDAAAGAVVSEVARLGTVAFPQSVADYHARFRAVLDPRAAATIQESVSVAQWTEQTPEGRPVVSVMLKVWPQERFPELRARIEAIAARAGGHVEYPYGDAFPAMVNSVDLSTAAGRHLSAEFGPESVLWGRASWPHNCEDFALFLREAPGAMFYLGVADAETGMNGAPHTRDFAADERAIGHGVRAMAALLTHRLHQAGASPATSP